ncbi:MAG: SDR family oxidoreductase, partial [Flavobacteriales bacterium]
MTKKNILITGASSGIGKASAQILSKQGHHLVLLSRRAPELHELNKELGGKHLVIPTDVTNYEEVQRAITQTINEV